MKKCSVKVLNESTALVNGIRIPIEQGCTSTTKGLRDKIFLKDVVIKFDDDYSGWFQSTRELNVYKNIEKQDKIYFGKIINGRRKRGTKGGWLVQERINFKKGKAPMWAKLLVIALISKYQIGDVTTVKRQGNWGMNKKTGLPIIYDFGIPMKKKRRG